MAMPEPGGMVRHKSCDPSERRALEAYCRMRNEQQHGETISECIRVFARSNHTEEDLKQSVEIENRLRDEFVRSVWFLTPKPRNRRRFVEKLAELLGPEEEERTRPRIHLSYTRAIVEQMTETDAFQSLNSKHRRRRTGAS